MYEDVTVPTAEELWAEFRGQYEDQPVGALTVRRSAVLDETARLESFGRRSKPQDVRLARLFGEAGVLDALISEKQIVARSERIAEIQRIAAEPGNLEPGADTGTVGGGGNGGARETPAFIRRTGDVLETPRQVIQRMGNPWRGEGGPLNAETGAGMVSRAHTALEGMSERLTPGGCEKVAQLLAESSGWPGMTVQRSRDETADAAELILALTNPHYETAFRSVLRYPMAFRNGTGMLMWSDEERLAFHDVMVSRAALIEDTGTGGQYLVPLVLDSNVMLTNAGSANPWRRVCRNVVTTSKTWNGVTSAGATAAWTAEGATATDGTPTLGALVITPFKESAWLMASFEEYGDTEVAQNVPALLEDAFSRLEEVAFTTGNGTTAPAGAITRSTVDANTSAVNTANATQVFPLLAALPPRFRIGDQAKPYWACNIAILNLLRAVAPFAAATASIVNDSTDDGVPEIFGYDVLESTTMDSSNAVGGHKNLLFFDANSFIVCERLGTTVVFEPLVASAGGILPSGVVGWFAYRRVSSDTPTATALRVHNNA